jgi:hypothetical protein
VSVRANVSEPINAIVFEVSSLFRVKNRKRLVNVEKIAERRLALKASVPAGKMDVKR